jgi:hypothetical protein
LKDKQKGRQNASGGGFFFGYEEDQERCEEVEYQYGQKLVGPAEGEQEALLIENEKGHNGKVTEYNHWEYYPFLQLNIEENRASFHIRSFNTCFEF